MKILRTLFQRIFKFIFLIFSLLQFKVYRIPFNPCSWHIIRFEWHNLIKLGVTLIKVQTADDIYPLLPHCVGVFFESEAWIWWNWINKMPLYWLFSICRGVNLLKYFWKTIFIWNGHFQKSNQGHTEKQLWCYLQSSYILLFTQYTFPSIKMTEMTTRNDQI